MRLRLWIAKTSKHSLREAQAGGGSGIKSIRGVVLAMEFREAGGEGGGGGGLTCQLLDVLDVGAPLPVLLGSAAPLRWNCSAGRSRSGTRNRSQERLDESDSARCCRVSSSLNDGRAPGLQGTAGTVGAPMLSMLGPFHDKGPGSATMRIAPSSTSSTSSSTLARLVRLRDDIFTSIAFLERATRATHGVIRAPVGLKRKRCPTVDRELYHRSLFGMAASAVVRMLE